MNTKTSNLRWLHISDFHIGKDGYGQSQLFKYILNHVKENQPPDFVFITGDIAQSGKAEQYEKFATELVQPLKVILGEKCKILSVPGNHDADRDKEEYVTREVITSKSPDFLDPDENGKAKRKSIISRFKAYAEYDLLYLDNGEWLSSSSAYYSMTEDVGGVCVGILGVNTAWFSEDDKDEKN